jgi:hypothetical protein
VEGRRVNGEGVQGQIWWMYFVYIYENWTMKSDEIFLRRGWDEENDGGGKHNKIHCKHICKCHDETLLLKKCY